MTVFDSTYRCGTVPDLRRVPCCRASHEAHQAESALCIVEDFVVNTKCGNRGVRLIDHKAPMRKVANRGLMSG